MPGVTEELARNTVAISYSDLPPSVVLMTKRVLLDCIGCALGSYVVDRSRIALELVNELGGHPSATVIGDGQTSFSLAAYANGELMNALDFDPLGPFTGHVAPYVLPPSLALCEHARSSGRDLITAIATALEVGGRVANSLSRHWLPTPEAPFYETNPAFSFSVTVFGAVAGIAKVLRLDAGRLTHAFGIAGTDIPAPRMQKWEQTPRAATMMKYGSNSGLLAQLATTATLLAERGFTADTAILDGEWNLQDVFGGPSIEPATIAGDLGNVWHIDAMIIKAFPCCGTNHTAIQALIRIMADNALDPDDIEEIVVMGDPLMLTPNRSSRTVVSFADTQFANAYIFAVVPYYGMKPSPAWQMPNTYTDPRVVALMKKVKTYAHPKATELIAERIRAGGWGVSFRDAVVEVHAGGKRYTAEEKIVKGSSGSPLSDDEIRAKFLANASYSPLRKAKAQRVVDIVYRLEELDDVSELMALLRVT